MDRNKDEAERARAECLEAWDRALDEAAKGSFWWATQYLELARSLAKTVGLPTYAEEAALVMLACRA